MGPPLFAQPAPTAEMTEVLHRVVGPADGEHIDVAPRGANDAERFLDREIGIAAITFDAGETLKLNGCFQFVINKHRGRRVMGAVVYSENEFRHAPSAIRNQVETSSRAGDPARGQEPAPATRQQETPRADPGRSAFRLT